VIVILSVHHLAIPTHKEPYGPFHRYPGVYLVAATSFADKTMDVRSRIECCALCQSIPGCESVNYRRKPQSSNGKQSCVPMTSTIPLGLNQELASDDDWEWIHK